MSIDQMTWPFVIALVFVLIAAMGFGMLGIIAFGVSVWKAVILYRSELNKESK